MEWGGRVINVGMFSWHAVMDALKNFFLVVIRKGQVVFAYIDRRWYEILFEGARTISQLWAACWALGTAGSWAALQHAKACGFCSPWSPGLNKQVDSK